MAVNNYEVWREDWRKRFLAMDKGALLKKLPFLRLEGGKIILDYFGERCGLRLLDGTIQCREPLSLNDELNIYTMLWYAKEGAALTGEWVSFSQLKDASPFDAAFRKGNLAPIAATFTGHMEDLEQALIAYGGKKLPHGDVGYEIQPFCCIPMRVLFWEGDDEFPAQANLLFDRSATDFIHVESIVTIASEGLKHLAKKAGLPIKGHGF